MIGFADGARKATPLAVGLGSKILLMETLGAGTIARPQVRGRQPPQRPPLSRRMRMMRLPLLENIPPERAPSGAC